MTIQTRALQYTVGEHIFEAQMAYDDAASGPVPAVLVCHAFRGREAFECERAQRLAELGYVGIAIDVYGEGKTAASVEAAYALMTPLVEDRLELGRRLQAAIATVAAQAEVDAAAMAAIGYCFGGLCALDLARANAPLLGVVSFHGLLSGTADLTATAIQPKVLVLHGWDDPMVPPQQVLDFTEEMTAAGADWQLHGYGGTVHAFSNPGANDAESGTVYHADAERRSWQATVNFLDELFN